MSPDARIARIEAQHPGMMIIAGPYAHMSTLPKLAKSERASAVRELRQQKSSDPKAKLIIVGRHAWVLRRADGWKYDSARKFQSTLGIRAGRGAKG